MTEKSIVSQVVGNTDSLDSSSTTLIIRASKYQKEDKTIFYRVSSTKDSQVIDYIDYIESADKCSKEFETLQMKYFGKIKQSLKMKEFI